MTDNPQSIHPAGWAKSRGYSNGVLADGQILYIGGQIGWNAQQELVATDFLGQARQALANIVAVLSEAGGTPRHLTRLTWYIVDMDEYRQSLRELGALYRELIGDWYPAMSAVEVRSLVEPQARVEIEATAVLPVS